MDNLIKDLLTKSQSEKRDLILNNAKKSMYHDFKSPYACPKMQLEKELRDSGFADLADKVINGDYDD
jgi:hypothetical protein